MSGKTIKIDVFSLESIRSAQKALTDYANRLKKLEEELPKALAEFGAVDAQARYDTSPYNIAPSGWPEQTDIKVTAQPTENGWAVIADGEEVCFVEFGAGVYYTGGNSAYLGERPPGIVGIGGRGDGRGKQDMWMYMDGGEKHWTHGTPASNSMYYAAQEVERRIVETARKILND